MFLTKLIFPTELQHQDNLFKHTKLVTNHSNTKMVKMIKARLNFQYYNEKHTACQLFLLICSQIPNYQEGQKLSE